MPSRRTVYAVNSITMTAMKGKCTLVPHANEIDVPPITDTTRAPLNLFPYLAGGGSATGVLWDNQGVSMTANEAT